jgi:hypothetical protein
VRGHVRPVLAGARVQIQRMGASAWTTVASAAVDQTGAFVARLNLTQGTYRARVLPTRGYVVGISQILRVLPA